MLGWRRALPSSVSMVGGASTEPTMWQTFRATVAPFQVPAQHGNKSHCQRLSMLGSLCCSGGQCMPMAALPSLASAAS